MAKTPETKISGIGILLMIISIAGVIFFSWQIAETFNGTKSMDDAATKMSKLASRSGNSVAEAYYNDHGEYLKGETKVYNRITLGIDAIGILVSALVFAYGGSKKTLIEAISTNYKVARSTKKSPKVKEELEEGEEDL